MQRDTPTESHEKKNTSIAGNVTKYSILHTQTIDNTIDKTKSNKE